MEQVQSLIKQVISEDEIPKIRKKRTSQVTSLLEKAIQQLKEGQAAELDQEVYNTHTLRWYLNRFHQQGLFKDVNITIRANGKKKKTAYLIRKKG